MTSKRRKMNDLRKQREQPHQQPATTSAAATVALILIPSMPASPQALTPQDSDSAAAELYSFISEPSVDASLSETDKIIFKSDYPLELLKKLNLMRSDPHLCDYEIRCNGHVFNVHKFVLIAVSDFFKVMLTGSLKESRENYVDLKGFNTTIGVEQMIEFAYTGVLKVTFENIIALLDAASHLQINDAIQLINEYLIKNCTQKNCVNILKLADRFSLNEVETNINDYLAKNFIHIYENALDQFLQLSFEQIIQQLESMHLQICSELDLFLIVCKWITADRSKRLHYAARILRHIRFMTMSSYELADYVEQFDFMRTIPECYQYLIDAYRFHALPLRQPLIKNEQAKLRNQANLVAVGETSLFVLNESKSKWEVVCSAPLEENYPYPFAAITFNNYLYVLGTRRTASEEYRTCYRFSPRTLEWTPLASLLHDRSRFGAAVVDNYIYIFGGFEGFKRSNRVHLNTIERYSIENDKWEEFINDSVQISSMAACTLDSLIYFGGGKNMNWSKVSDFYCINVNTKEIEKKANMLTARTTHQIAVCEERIIVVGGFDEAGNGILSIESYDNNNDQWSVITNIPGNISKTWPQSVGVLNGTKFYISVFHTPNTFKIIQKGYYYDLLTNIWTEAPVVHERARYCPTCSIAFPRKVYSFNGTNDEIVVQHSKELLNQRIEKQDDQEASIKMDSLIIEEILN